MARLLALLHQGKEFVFGKGITENPTKTDKLTHCLALLSFRTVASEMPFKEQLQGVSLEAEFLLGAVGGFAGPRGGDPIGHSHILPPPPPCP